MPKKNPLKQEDLTEFIKFYNPDSINKRNETYHAEKNPEGRWRKFTYYEIIAQDKTSKDITQIKDKSLTDLDNLTDLDVLVEDIIENLQAGIESFKEIMTTIGSNKKARDFSQAINLSHKPTLLHTSFVLDNLFSKVCCIYSSIQKTVNIC